MLEASDGSGRLLVLTPASGEQREVDLRSQGAFRYDALSRDGRVLFLNEHQGDQIEHAFVHALMVDGPASFCVDLPGGRPPAGGTWSIAVRPDGAVEVVAGGSRHLVAAGPHGFPAVVLAA